MTFQFFADEVQFREQTDRQASCPGVTLPTFKCIACKRVSVTKGCKRTAAGTICAACHQAREYRKAIKRAKEAKQ